MSITEGSPEEWGSVFRNRFCLAFFQTVEFGSRWSQGTRPSIWIGGRYLSKIHLRATPEQFSLQRIPAVGRDSEPTPNLIGQEGMFRLTVNELVLCNE